MTVHYAFRNANMQAVKQLKQVAYLNYSKVIAAFVLIVLVAVIIFRNWIFTSEWPGGGDVLGWISAEYTFGNDLRWLYVWRRYSFGFVSELKLTDILFASIYSIFHDPAVTIKVFTFSSFLLAGFSMYAFAYHYNKRHLPALFASIIYILNQWFFSQLTEAHLGIIFGYALAPLLFLLLDRALTTRKIRDILLLALGVTVLITTSNPQCTVIYGFFLIVFTAFYLLSTVKTNFYLGIKRFFKTILLAGFTVLLLSAFWLTPLLSNVGGYYYSSSFQHPIESTYWNVTHWSYPNITDGITLRAVESWGYEFIVDVYEGLALPDFPVYTLFLVIFIIAYATGLIRINRYTIFFAISALISLLVSKGPQSPFGYIFEWCWFNIPHFSVFRVPSRWAMMTALSNAFFVSILVSILVCYMQEKRHTKMHTIVFRLHPKDSSCNENKQHYFSIDSLDEIAKSFHKVLYYISGTILVLIILGAFFSCFFFFDQGLQVYTPPQNYIEPYEWIANQSGDYKIVTVGWDPDLGSSAMATSLGWGHDLGYDSSFIHDKPVLQDGGWSQLANNFVGDLRNTVVPLHITENALKILGTLNYRYVVLPSYVNNDLQMFFLNQKGGMTVFNESSIIIENEFFTPLVFSSKDYAVVIGNVESFWSLAKIDSFDFSRIAIVFPYEADKSEVTTLLDDSQHLIFVNTDMQEAIMLLLSDELNVITTGQYGYQSTNSSKYWTASDWWRMNGQLVLGEETLTTEAEESVDIPFSVTSNDVYDVWMRIAFAPNRGNLSVYVDDKLVKEIHPISDLLLGPKWVNLTSLNLKRGNHVMTLKNDGTGYNDVDVIAVIKADVLQSKINELTDTLQRFSGRIAYVLEAETSFKIPASMYIQLDPYDGYVVHSEGADLNIAPEGTATASSVSVLDISNLGADGANDGDPNTRWASEPLEIPQWLQIEWDAPQELTGAHIVFENAYAENYTIQTWNGTGWVNQVNVTGNTLLDRSYMFLEPVKTYKLRLYVTSAPAYNMVSTWELEAYTTPWLSTNLSTPREDRYMFCIRLAQGPNQGTPQLKIDNTTVAVQQLTSSAEEEWYIAGPIHLNASSHLIEIGGSGKIDFDQLLIYSLEDEEQIVFLDDFSLHATELGRNVSPEGISSASSVGVWDPISLVADGANDGDPNTRWASNPHELMPQWLQIEWETPQELTGAYIRFEKAYAEDYSIQTWNGTDWVDQISVEGNNQLNCTHVFEEPVTADKLRISVTSVTALYDLVSIWELEAYTTPTVSRTVFIPQDGHYRVGFQIASGPNYGTLNLTINNTPTTILCNGSSTESKLYENGPVYFKAGEQNVTVSATGTVDFDEMTLTLNDEGDFGFLDDLFEAKPGPNVSYERINPCKYEAHIENSDEPFLLIFSESYHPMWKAYIDDEEVSPIPTYSTVNGFYINKTGSFDVTIYFTGQTYADIGLQISLTTLIIVVILLAIPSKKFEQLENYLKQKTHRKTHISRSSQAKEEGESRLR